MILMKIPWNKQLYLTVLLMLSFVSCQTKKLYFSAYKDLPLEEKQEVNTYLAEVKQAYPNNDNEIILMLNYECFLNQSVIINKKIQKEFRCAKSPDFERNLSTHCQSLPTFPHTLQLIPSVSNQGYFFLKKRVFSLLCHFTISNKFE